MSQLPTAPVAKATVGLLSITTRMVLYKVVSNGAVAAVAVVTARQLGPSGRGVLVLLLTLASFTLLLSSLGISTSGRIHLVGEGREVDSNDFFGLAAVLTLLEVVLCAVLGVVLLPVVGVHLSPSEQALFGLLGGSLLAPYFLNAALNAYGFTTLATAIDAAGSVAQLGLVLILFWQGTTAVDPYVGALVAGNVVQVGLGLVAVRRQGIDLRPRCRRRPWRLLVRTGLPGIALDVGQVLTFKIDRYLLGAMLSPAAVGVYSVAATAPELLRLPTLALSQPIFHRLASGSARITDFRRTRRLSLAVTAVLTAATFFVAPFAVKLLFGDRFAAAVTPLRVLLLAEFGITVFYLDASSLAAGMHRVGDAGVAALAGFAVVALSDLLLIPSYGIAGAAWASVIAYTVMGLVAHLLLRHRTGGERILSPEGSTGPVPGTVIEEPSG